MPRKRLTPVSFTATFQPDLLGGVTVLTAKATQRDTAGWGDDLYSADAGKSKPVVIKAVPYACWANRKPGEMRVWLNIR